MKLNMTCLKCSSPQISIAENTSGKTPMYKCDKCGYTHELFPKFKSDKNEEEGEN